MQERIFRIRRVSDGLYSTGGYIPTFNKKGKSWRRLGDVKAALSIASRYYKSYRETCSLEKNPVPFWYDGCMVVEYLLQEINAVSIDDVDQLNAKK